MGGAARGPPPAAARARHVGSARLASLPPAPARAASASTRQAADLAPTPHLLPVEEKLRRREEQRNEEVEHAAAAREITISFNADVSGAPAAARCGQLRCGAARGPGCSPPTLRWDARRWAALEIQAHAAKRAPAPWAVHARLLHSPQHQRPRGDGGEHLQRGSPAGGAVLQQDPVLLLRGGALAAGFAPPHGAHPALAHAARLRAGPLPQPSLAPPALAGNLLAARSPAPVVLQEQRLRPGERIDMPVFFYIDPGGQAAQAAAAPCRAPGGANARRPLHAPPPIDRARPTGCTRCRVCGRPAHEGGQHHHALLYLFQGGRGRRGGGRRPAPASCCGACCRMSACNVRQC